jgi:hypothetical protein
MDPRKITVSKLDVVRTQVETAIRLYFAEGDPVSIHTLAAASFQILVDLDKHGPQTGTLLNDIERHVKPEYVKEVLKMFAKPENFFKHADWDPEAVLDFPLSEPEFYLWECVAKYRELAGNDTPLMQVYRAWFMAHNSQILTPVTRVFIEYMDLASDFPENDRVRFFEMALPVFIKKSLEKLRNQGS